MMLRNTLIALLWGLPAALWAQTAWQVHPEGYFHQPGLEVTVFTDYYPDGHQTGVTLIQHGRRVAANGDLRLEISPGQWSPVPKGGDRQVDSAAGRITQTLWYPDSSKNRQGFNPIAYPDLTFRYQVRVEALPGRALRVAVDLETPLPPAWEGRMGFNFELFPGELYGRAYLMDSTPGTFLPQPGGPLVDPHGEWLAAPLATGRRLVVAPEEALQRLQIESHTGPLELWDGRLNHNNGWYIVRTPLRAGVTRGAAEWTLTPHAVPGWQYPAVVQVSQVGYHPQAPKQVIIEQDGRDSSRSPLVIYRLTAQGPEAVHTGLPHHWGKFLRYQYLQYDFSALTTPGMYQVAYRDRRSAPFQISPAVYDRHVWQPTLAYFLPVQMCHMRVNEKYRVWHDSCHLDDARMAPVDTNHFDGYRQGPETLTRFAPYESVPGLNHGGWHDAGDYDLRVESQIGTVHLLALMIEQFGLDYDATTIDPVRRLVEIHQPDGRSDAIQQIEHGLASVLGGYRALGRLYRGIICHDLRQYVMLGDAAAMTDNIVRPDAPGHEDDRWVFTEDNPQRALQVAAGLAAAARVLREENPPLAAEAQAAALALYATYKQAPGRPTARLQALAELILTTGDRTLRRELVSLQAEAVADVSRSAWALGRVMPLIQDTEFVAAMTAAVGQWQADLQARAATDSPYGVPYQPNIWGAGWTIQRFGVEQYFVYQAWPTLGTAAFFLQALHFILGAHPGENTASFASGVGAQSALVAYGVNRADWSYIPGGVASGTALIRPDLPEFKVWPYFWQQTEYVMGGGATNFMFLALAAQQHWAR